MKLRITIEDKVYDVEVEILDPQPVAVNGSAASRVEGLAVRPGLKPLDDRNGAARPVAARPAAPTPSGAGPSKPAEQTAARGASALGVAGPPAPRQPIRPWHDLTVGEHGEVTAPVAGTIVSLIAKVGDAVRPGDPLLELEIENLMASKAGPVRGTVRATDAGTIAEIPVQAGTNVKFGQPLVCVKLEKVGA